MPNDEIQAAHIEWQRKQFERSKLAWEWLQRYMRPECDDALRKFVEVNPRQNGIQWWDALSIMDDSDSHLEVTEPMADVMDEWVSPLHTYVICTLMYASRLFAGMDTDLRVQAVRHTIANNGGVPEGLRDA